MENVVTLAGIMLLFVGYNLVSRDPIEKLENTFEVINKQRSLMKVNESLEMNESIEDEHFRLTLTDEGLKYFCKFPAELLWKIDVPKETDFMTFDGKTLSFRDKSMVTIHEYKMILDSDVDYHYLTISDGKIAISDINGNNVQIIK